MDSSAKNDRIGRENAGLRTGKRLKRNLRKRPFRFWVETANFYKLCEEARYGDESVASLLNRVIAQYLGTDQPRPRVN